MAIVENWVTAAASEIAELPDVEQSAFVELIVKIIKKHCPFKQNVAYEEVRSRTFFRERHDLDRKRC